MRTITIVSELEHDLQAWTFDISEDDLQYLMEKYDGKGSSILGDTADIAEEIQDTYK